MKEKINMNKKNEEYGLVLAGGGIKGAYQVGVWKALKEIGIKITAITGASIGSINGAFMIQNDIKKMVKLYENINISDVIEVNSKIDAEKDILSISNIRKIFKEYIENKGLGNAPLKNMLSKNLDIDLIYNSNIDYGLISYSFKNKKPIQLFKKDIPKEKLIDYILASSCFPIFKSQKIGDVELVDGGFFDNAPINMLIDKGYKKIIVVDVQGIGFNKKTESRDVYIKLLSPSEDLGGLFYFNHENIKKNINIGYLDTMKSFSKMQGNYFYFPQEEFIKMLNYFNLQMIEGLELAGKIYNMDRYKVYTYNEFIKELYEKHKEAEKKYKLTKKSFQNKSIKETFKNMQNSEIMLCFAVDVYIGRPTAKKFKLLDSYVKAVEAILELEKYMEN